MRGDCACCPPGQMCPRTCQEPGTDRAMNQAVPDLPLCFPAPAGPLASLLLCSPAHLAFDGVLSTACQSGAALGGALRTLHLGSPRISTRPGARQREPPPPPEPTFNTLSLHHR